MRWNPKSILPGKLPRNPNLLQEAVRRRNFLAKEVTAAAKPLTVYLKGGSNKKRSLPILICGIALMGCATTAQVKALEEKTQQALDTAEEALKEAQKATALEKEAERAEETAMKASREAQAATAAVEDSARYKNEAAASAQRAEDAALRAEKAAAAAEDSARKAEEAAKKCEDILEKIMAK